MSPNAGYIGGQRANYCKSYVATQLDLDDADGHTQNLGLQHLCSKRGGGCNQSEKSRRVRLGKPHRVAQARCTVAVLWGEAAQVRFVPKCLYFKVGLIPNWAGFC